MSNNLFPEWLKSSTSDIYRLFHSREIKPEHYAPILDKHLPKRHQLYWFAIQNTSKGNDQWEAWKRWLKPENIADFCRLTVEWYSEASNPGRLPGGQTALTATGWLPAAKVFYHPKLNESELNESANYPALGEAIALLYGETLPVPEMLPLLGTEPFALGEAKLARAGNVALLTGPQLTALRALAQAVGTRLTDHFTVRTEGAAYRFTPRTGGQPVPCHTPDDGIRALLAAHAPDLHPLPLDAHGRALQGEEAVVKGAELLKALLAELPPAEWQSAETLAVLEASGFPSVVREWLGKFTQIQIELEEDYPADHPNRRLLELAATTLQPGEYAALREMLFLFVPHNTAFCLAGAAEADEIKLETTTGTAVTLRRAELLPGADEKSELVNLLADRLQAGPALRALLGLGEAHDHGHLQNQVLAELAADNNTVQNVQQLTYLLLTSQQTEKLGTANVLAKLNVTDRTGEVLPLNAEWYAAAPDFIEPTYVLAPQFAKWSAKSKPVLV